MKNIHTLATTNASKLKHTFDYRSKYLTLSREPLYWRYACYVYVTSDENIQEGDFAIIPEENGWKSKIWYYKNSGYFTLSGELCLYDNSLGFQKIILTNDPKLIADGVQEVSEEFLKWLVENPNAESIEITQWAEIIKEEDKMKTQKLSRKGLKEIHAVACSSWKSSLELLGARNPLEDYIELNQDQVDAMFKACTASQFLIVSKHLKQWNIQDIIKDIDDIQLETVAKGLLKVRVGGEFTYKSFTLHADYDWKIQQDTYGFKCLIPTKKK